MEENYIKLIFGLKLKQIRNDKNLSLFGLSKLTGLSKSYLNEIEKGKKYPKTDKIALLSEALDIPYDNMVSLKLDKNLAPIGDILQSKILKEIPLEVFGIKESTLIDIVSNAPAKVNAFISTIIEIATHYNFSRESFYLASLRSFQEANNNYFDNIEQAVLKFSKAYQINLEQPISTQELEDILIEEYNYTIKHDIIDAHGELENLRSLFVPKSKTLLLSSEIDDAQRAFIYAKEIGYNHLELEERLYTFPWITFNNFDQVLNNFYASYFAGALVIPRTSLTSKLSQLFKKERFDSKDFIEIMTHYNASPESFYQRLTNILPKDFNIHNLFFLRFTHKKGSEKFHLKKELHLSHHHSPRANEFNQHYCRRWVSIKSLQTVANSNHTQSFDVQVSEYPDTKTKYLVLSSATKDPFKTNQYRSISIGLLVNKSLEKKLNFLNDTKINTKEVGVTCERCSIINCKERKAPASSLEKTQKHHRIKLAVNDLMKQFE